MNKECLGQNASQILCLFQNIPFILYCYKDDEKLKKVWICVEYLLKITQIIYSLKIDESDLTELEKLIETYLENLMELFGVHLTSKHHNMTHYTSEIRDKGPLKRFSMMRYEAKHHELKTCIGDSNNFMNLTKTIAQRHQQMMPIKQDTYADHFKHGPVIKSIDNDFFTNHKEYFMRS